MNQEIVNGILLGTNTLLVLFSILITFVIVNIRNKCEDIIQTIFLLAAKLNEEPKEDTTDKRKELDQLENSLNMKLNRVKELRAKL
jgi:hypothetical protein